MFSQRSAKSGESDEKGAAREKILSYLKVYWNKEIEPAILILTRRVGLIGGELADKIHISSPRVRRLG